MRSSLKDFETKMVSFKLNKLISKLVISKLIGWKKTAVFSLRDTFFEKTPNLFDLNFFGVQVHHAHSTNWLDPSYSCT